MRYVLHIGTNKTGTSTLQHYLGTYRDDLLQQGIWYPRTGQHRFAHHDFALGLKKNDFKARDVQPELIRDPPTGTTVTLLSSEAFHTMSTLDEVLAWFPPEDTTVILYLREHVSYLASWYQQAAQQRLITCSFPEFAQLYSRQFSELAARWRDRYGDNLKVRTYDRSKLHAGDIVADFFMTAFGVELPLKREFEDKNPSISGNLLFLKLLLNHMLSAEENTAIVEELSTLSYLDKRFSGKLAVSPEEAKRIGRLHAADRKILKREYKVVFAVPRDGIGGNIVPDLANLQADMQLILGAAKKRGFALHDVLRRKRELLFPP